MDVPLLKPSPSLSRCCLGYPLLRLHPSLSPLIRPPSLAVCRMTSSRSGIDDHQKKKPLGWTLRPFVCAFERGINMEEKKECCNPPFKTHIHCSPLPADGWFIRPIQNYMHTPTRASLTRAYAGPPAVAAAFDDVFKELHSFPKPYPFLPHLFHLSYPFIRLDAAGPSVFSLDSEPKRKHLQCHPSSGLLLDCHLPLSLNTYSWSVPFPILLKFCVLLRNPSVCLTSASKSLLLVSLSNSQSTLTAVI